MKISKKLAALLLVFVYTIIFTLSVSAEGKVPRFTYIKTVDATLSFAGSTAYCILNVDTYSGVDSIYGAFTLETTDGTVIDKWSDTQNGTSFSLTGTTNVTEKGAYLLYYTITVKSGSASESTNGTTRKVY